MLAAALGEHLAAGVQVVERAAGRQIHQLAPVGNVEHPGYSRALEVWGTRGWALTRCELAATSPNAKTNCSFAPASSWGPGPALPLANPLERGASALLFPWLQLALRGGVHHIRRLPSDRGELALLVGLRGHLLRFDQPLSGRPTWSVALQYAGFAKPAQRGLLVDSRGRIWVAMYDRNLARAQQVHLWRSDDGGRSFWIGHSFGTAKVRHIHFIQEDQVDGSLWLGTGDGDRESGLWRSTDGDTWVPVGGGSQLWRTVGLAFGDDAIRWGTDAGRDAPRFANCAVRLDRHSGQLSIEQELQGPVHGVSALPAGRTVLTTGCEGGRGRTEPRIHLWIGSRSGQWRELASWRQGLQPARLQYAVAQLVDGQEHTSELWLQLRGALSMPLGLVRLRVPD